MIVELWNGELANVLQNALTIYVLFLLRCLPFQPKHAAVQALKMLGIWFLLLFVYEGTQEVFGVPFFADLVFIAFCLFSKGALSVRVYVTMCMVLIGPTILYLPSYVDQATQKLNRIKNGKK